MIENQTIIYTALVLILVPTIFIVISLLTKKFPKLETYLPRQKLFGVFLLLNFADFHSTLAIIQKLGTTVVELNPIMRWLIENHMLGFCVAKLIVFPFLIYLIFKHSEKIKVNLTVCACLALITVSNYVGLFMIS